MPVDDLVVHPRDDDLVVGTHGRGIYILDDVAPLTELSADVLRSQAHLFSVRTVTEFHLWKHESYGAQRQFIGANPPYGAIISYYLSEDAEDEDADEDGVVLTVLDPAGETVRELHGPDGRGIQRLAWDLRAAVPDGLDADRGPLVPPGRYTVRLEARGLTQEQSVEVVVDPAAARIDQAEHDARYAFLMAVNDLRATVAKSLATLEEVDSQVQALLARGDDLPAAVTAAANDAREAARPIRERLRGPDDGPAFGNPNLRSLASRLFGELDGGTVQQGTFGGPTAGQRDRMAALRRSVDDAVGDVNAFLTSSVPALNEAVATAGLSWIQPADPVAPPRGR